MDYMCAQHDTLKTSKHCRANLDSGRTLVKWQILSVIDSYKLVW